jgi:TPR repeat protein
MYSHGQGVPQDYVLAHMWLNLASASSQISNELQEEGARVRDGIARKMTPQQIAEAQRMAREWKPTQQGK